MQEASLKQYIWAADPIRHKIDRNQLDSGTREITDSSFTRKHQSPEDIQRSWHACMIFYLSSICLISVTVVTLQNHPTPGYAVITREKANYISYNKPPPSISRRFAAGYPL